MSFPALKNTIPFLDILQTSSCVLKKYATMRLARLYGSIMNSVFFLLRKPLFQIKNVIKKNPELRTNLNFPAFCADFSHVIKWEWWFYEQKRSDLSDLVEDIQKDRFLFKCYQKYMTGCILDDLRHITQEVTLKNFRCDIKDIEGITASKSDLSVCSSLDEFAETYCPDFIQSFNQDNLNKHLHWEDKRILRHSTLHTYQWNENKIRMVNSGGSHHFAAARYIAVKLNEKVECCLTLKHRELIETSVLSLVRTLYMYAVPRKLANKVYNAMGFKKMFFFLKLPMPIDDFVVVCFYRHKKMSNKISSLFQDSALFDFGAFLVSELEKNNLSRPSWRNDVG
jgi:hypothetical protein